MGGPAFTRPAPLLWDVGAFGASAHDDHKVRRCAAAAGHHVQVSYLRGSFAKALGDTATQKVDINTIDGFQVWVASRGTARRHTGLVPWQAWAYRVTRQA